MSWGALHPRKQSLSPAFFVPPHASSGLWWRVQRSGPINRAWELGRDVPPEPPRAHRPKPRGSGWNRTLGKLAHFAATKALPSMIPHRSTTKLRWLRDGAWGTGVVEQTHTHAQHRQRDKGRKHFQLMPLWLQMLTHCPLVVAMHDAAGPTPGVVRV